MVIIIIVMKLHEPIQTRTIPKRKKEHPSFAPHRNAMAKIF